MPQLQDQPTQQQHNMDEHQDEDENQTSSPPSEAAGTSLLLPGAKLRGPQPPPVNPLQFIKVSPPVNLYKPPPQREMPPVERIRKEEPEDWQNDLEGWKVNRRKRQEQLMERVSEIKKSEEEQCNPSSRKNKTFSEMMRGRKCSIVVHNDEDNDLSDLGIGKKDRNGERESEEEDEEEEETMISEKENEFTYEKAIQNYVEFASSRVSKPVISTSTITHTNEINVTCITSSSESRETESWKESSVRDIRSNTIPDEAPSIAQAVLKPSSQMTVSSQSTETRNSVQGKSSLFEKISVFEKPAEITTSKILESKQSKPKEDIPTSPTKKLRPPVPAKPKAANKEEAQCVSLHQAATVESAPPHTSMVWNNMSESQAQRPVSRVNIEETSEMIFSSSSSAVNTELRLQQTNVHSKEMEPSLVFSDDSSTIDMELSPTSSSVEMPVCNASLKLMEPTAASSSLDHVNPRDIQRSPLGGEDSGVHTADSVSQSDEVEEEEELPSQANLEMSTGLLGILTSQTPIIDHELSALLAPPSRLEPPREKPPPPPPVGMEPDTETMRKSFLGLEVTQPSVAPTYEAPSVEPSETDTLGSQLKERLLRLEEEKNNLRNMEKQIKAEKQSPHAAPSVPVVKDNAGNQENLAREREALRIEREAIASRKQASFAKKLAVRSLDSLDIPPQQEMEAVNDDRVLYSNVPISNNNNNNIINNNEAMKLHHHPVQMSQDDTYVSTSVEKESMSQYFHPPVKQHSVDELQSPYEHHHHNDLISHSDNFNLPIRKSQSEGHLLSHQNMQQSYSSPPKQSINDRSSNHITTHEQYSKQYQAKQHENNYQQNVSHPKSSPEYPISQTYYTPPSPRYEINNKHYYEDSQSPYFEPHQSEPVVMPVTSGSQGSWNKQPNYIQPAPPIRKKGPPPPAKPSRIPQQQHLTRNYSADSILESVDGDAPVALRRNKPSISSNSGTNGRSSMPYSLGGSMSQLPSQKSMQPQPRQRPTSTQGINYQHWLVQEAEHRRITEHQQRQAAANPRQPKHLPDAIIMSLTQRVQQRQSQIPQRTSPQRTSVEDKVLSVSGKKKCSHCNLELGRGAAMIIESLRLFYHIDCFKCCVCCIQLGDGLMGTDVRVRNGKLHCHSCYSSDDGVKFSCV